jgi:hypothetical protein
MLIEESTAPLRAATESVSGLKTTEDALDAFAFCETQTPPPVVPTYKRFPVASDGSSATAETLPVTSPKFGVTTPVGPSACHVAAA